jgi:four helix bundle protein
MKKQNIIMDKSYAFALRIIKAYKFLSVEQREFILSKQLLRSGTAIGALVKESEHAQSKADFISKMSIALKEANETEYWLMLLKDSNFFDEKSYQSINNDCQEVLSLLVSIIKTAKENLKLTEKGGKNEKA